MKRLKQVVVTHRCKDGEEGTFIEKMSRIGVEMGEGVDSS
jgi:hypothetical protein